MRTPSSLRRVLLSYSETPHSSGFLLTSQAVLFISRLVARTPRPHLWPLEGPRLSLWTSSLLSTCASLLINASQMVMAPHVSLQPGLLPDARLLHPASLHLCRDFRSASQIYPSQSFPYFTQPTTFLRRLLPERSQSHPENVFDYAYSRLKTSLWVP